VPLSMEGAAARRNLVLTIRYTARASTALRQSATKDLNSRLARTAGQALWIDLKRDFPAIWAQAIGALGAGATTISLSLD
jgi:hypothetical protein